MTATGFPCALSAIDDGRIPVSREGFRRKDQEIEQCEFAPRVQSLGEQEVVVADRYNNQNFPPPRRETASGYYQWLCQRTGRCRVGSRHRFPGPRRWSLDVAYLNITSAKIPRPTNVSCEPTCAKAKFGFYGHNYQPFSTDVQGLA